MRLFVLMVPACALLAQETVHQASVSGRVLDASGAAVPAALVRAEQRETNLKREVRTDEEGRFRLPYLRVGPYRLTAQHAGFMDTVKDLTLSVGAAYELTLELKIGVAGSTVDVSADAVAIETARSQIAGTVSQTEARNLPLNGRSFLDLTLLIPGVSPTNTGSNQLFAETSAVPGQGISVGSQRNLSNNFVVDGLSANDDAAGLSGVFYGLDTVQELQVVTSGGQAELGRALGGYISVVTKSGTNQLHGDLYGYFRNRRWNAANPLNNRVLPMTQAQYGVSLGGPVAKDRTFYFGNFERRQLNQTGLITITDANVAAVNAQLDATGFRGARIATGIYPNPVRLTNILAKLDHQLTPADQFSLRYSRYGAGSENSRGAGALNAASASSGLDNTDQTVAVNHVHTFSSRTVSETRGQFTRSDLLALPSDPAGPTVSIAGVANFGRLASSPAGRENSLVEIVSNLSHQAGAHAVRAGVNFLHNRTTITFPRSVRGQYSFSSLANFRQGVYNNGGYTQTFGNTVTAQTNPNAGFYLQDEWKARPSLTFNAGLRYDLQFLHTIQTDRNNLSPRLGFAWSPGAARRTVIRGGAGLYYDRVPLRALANALLSAGNTTTLTPASQVSVSLAPTQTGAPTFPNVLTSLPAGVLVNFTTMDRRLQNAYSLQLSIEAERQLGRGLLVSAGYQRLRGLHLLMAVNQNVPTCLAAGNNNGCRPNPAYANNSQYRSLADSVYNALHLSLQQRVSRWGSFRVTRSPNRGTTSASSSSADPSTRTTSGATGAARTTINAIASSSMATPNGAGFNWAASCNTTRLCR